MATISSWNGRDTDVGDHSDIDHTGLTGISSGNVATDSIWDAAGDLAVGSGANTAAKLAIGAAGGALSRVNGAVAWNSGTAFPTAATGDRYWRTDKGLVYYYDGTRWVTEQLMMISIDSVAAISATGVTTKYAASLGVAGLFSDLWLIEAIWEAKVGATNTGAAYWTVDLYKQFTDGSADASIASSTTQSLTASRNYVLRTAIGALAGSTAAGYYGFATKVGSPSNFEAPVTLLFRGVST